MSRRNIVDSVITLNEEELCVRVLEAATGETRPSTWTAEEALSTVEPEIKDQIIATARAALLYFTECYDGRITEPAPTRLTLH